MEISQAEETAAGLNRCLICRQTPSHSSSVNPTSLHVMALLSPLGCPWDKTHLPLSPLPFPEQLTYTLLPRRKTFPAVIP